MDHVSRKTSAHLQHQLMQFSSHGSACFPAADVYNQGALLIIGPSWSQKSPSFRRHPVGLKPYLERLGGSSTRGQPQKHPIDLLPPHKTTFLFELWLHTNKATGEREHGHTDL